MTEPEPLEDQEQQAPLPPITCKRRQKAAFPKGDRIAPLPQAKRVSRNTSRPSTGGHVKEPAQVAPTTAAVRAKTVKPKPQPVPSTSSPAVKAPSTRSKLEDYHPDSHTLVPVNPEKNRYIELRCCYCGGNTANHTEKRHMRGAKGLQMHLNQVHGHQMPLVEVTSLTKFREVSLQEIHEMEDHIKAGGTTHIEFIQSQRNGPANTRQTGPGGWLSLPCAAGAGGVATQSAAGVNKNDSIIVSDEYDVPKSDSFGPIESAMRSTLQNQPIGPVTDDDAHDATSATMVLAGKLKAFRDRRSLEL